MKKFAIAGLVSFLIIPVMFITLIAGVADGSSAPVGGSQIELNGETFIVPIKKGQYVFNERFGDYVSLDGSHYGVDMASSIGTVVYAVSDGVVVESFDGCENTPQGEMSNWAKYCSSERGNHILVDVTFSNNQKITMAYYHLQNGTVKPSVGTEVKQGQAIAQVGNSGKTTGSHLHLEFQSIYNSYPSSYDNRIDPEPYLCLTPFGERVEEDEEYHYCMAEEEHQEEGGESYEFNLED